MFLAALALRLRPVPRRDLPRLASPLARLLRAPPADRLGRAELPARPVSRSVPEPSGRRRLHLASGVRPRRGRRRARFSSGAARRRNEVAAGRGDASRRSSARSRSCPFSPSRGGRFGRRRARIATAAYVAPPRRGALGRLRPCRPSRRRDAWTCSSFLAAGAWAALRARRRAIARAPFPSGAAIALRVLTWQGAVFVGRRSRSSGPRSRSARPPPSAGLAATALVALGAAATLPAEPVPFSFVSFGWFQPLLLAGATAAASRARDPARAHGPAARAVGAPHGSRPRSRAAQRAARSRGRLSRRGVRLQGRRGRAGERLRGRRLPLLPARVPAPRRRVPAAPRGLELASSARCARSRPASSSCRSRRSLWLRGGAAAAQAPGRGAPPRSPSSRRPCSDGPLPAAQRLLPRDLRRARARRAPRADRAAPVPRRARGPRFRSLSAACLVVAAAGAPYPRAGAWTFADGARVRRPRPLRAAPRARSAAGDPSAAAAARARRRSRASCRPGPLGHFVTALAERPSAADPFVYGWRRQCRLFTATDDAEALAILPRRQLPLPRHDGPSRRSCPPTRPPPAARRRPTARCSRSARARVGRDRARSRSSTRVLDSRTARPAAGRRIVPAALPGLSASSGGP